MKQLTDLPIYDLCPIIFRNLSINDLFNCRLVNKQFKYFSDHSNGIYKLAIGKPFDNYFDNDYHWFFNNKLIEEEDIISLECFRTIKLLSIFNLDKNLTHLKIYDSQFDLKELSSLINLEFLEFGSDFYNGNQQIINLNNLKIFISNFQSVKLYAPKLEKIYICSMHRIKLSSNPESIKHLVTNEYDSEFEIFKNLEIIELRNNYASINENLLIIFKNLTQLKISLTSSSYEIMEDSLIKILNDKIKLRKEIDIYLEGVKIENIDKLNEFKENKHQYWKFRLTNYDLLDSNLSSIYFLRYEELQRCVYNLKNDLPSTFFDKFQYINMVHINFSVDDVNGFNLFLNNLKYLTELIISYYVSPLGEVFYNNLPNTIKCLNIANTEDHSYDFIFKLSKLIKLDTFVDKDLFDLAFSSFLYLKYLNYFSFYYKRNPIYIKKKGKYFYLNGIDEKLDYNQLIVKCNKKKIKLNNIKLY